jgi:hypothetical protein
MPTLAFLFDNSTIECGEFFEIYRVIIREVLLSAQRGRNPPHTFFFKSHCGWKLHARQISFNKSHGDG